MRLDVLVIVFALCFFGTNIRGQETQTCKVLLENLQGKYDGDCKDGLAHGSGTAEGVDTYKGKFKEGLPSGKGVYTWANGDKYEGKWKNGERNGFGKMYYAKDDKKVEGVWKNDKLFKEKKPPQYKITYKQNVDGVTITKMDESVNQVEIVFYRNGVAQYTMPGLSLEGSSGFERRVGTFCGYENVEFPFEAYITYQAWNQFQTVLRDCTLKFTIDSPGNWLVKIDY